jgi:hypothetical protein
MGNSLGGASVYPQMFLTDEIVTGVKGMKKSKL